MSIATGWPSFAAPKLRPPTSASASALPGGVTASPTITTSESATPGPAVAATIALPGATPVTSPVLDTVTTFSAPLVQVASEGDSCFPAMSVTTAVSCVAFPGLRVVSVRYPGLTRTAAGAVSGATVSRRVSAAPRIAASTRAAPPGGLRRAVTATGTPVTGVWAESTLIRSTNEPPVASVESCGATVTMQPDPIWHGPTYLTGTATGGLRPAPL